MVVSVKKFKIHRLSVNNPLSLVARPQATIGAGIVDQLPFQIMLNVLAKLGAEDLMTFSLVCKNWCGVITDFKEVRKQFYRRDPFSCSGRNKVRLLYSTKPPRSVDYAALINVGHPVDGYELKFPELKFPELHNIKIVGSCDGITCLEEGTKVYLWNPNTMETKILTKPEGFQSELAFYGFGFDPTLSDYKVILGTKSVAEDGVSTLKIAAFKLREGTWSSKEGLEYMQVYGQGHFSDGALHWTEMRRVLPDPPIPGTRIVSFILSDEVFKESLQLSDLTGGQSYIFEKLTRTEIGLGIYMNGHNRIKIWESKSYKVKNSWEEVIEIELRLGGPGSLRTNIYSEGNCS